MCTFNFLCNTICFIVCTNSSVISTYVLKLNGIQYYINTTGLIFTIKISINNVKDYKKKLFCLQICD